MKKFLSLLYAAMYFISAQAQGPDSWIQRSSLGSAATPRQGAVSFSIGNKGYVGLGNEGDGFFSKKDFWEYNPVKNTWTQKADFAGGERSNAVGFNIGKKGYVGTGDISIANSYNDFWEYDPGTNSWTRKADFGGVPRTGAMGFSIGNRGYIGAGVGVFFDYAIDFWEYDPATDVWTRKGNVGKRIGAKAFSIGGKGYAGTGTSDSSGFSILKKDFWEYDPATDNWVRKADLPGGERTGAIAFSIEHRGFIGTGYNYTNGYLRDFWEYNPLLNSWRKRPNFPGGERSGCIGFGIDSNGYVGTGFDGSHLKNDFWKYDRMSNSWTQKANFGALGRTGTTGFSIGEKGYIGTGYGNTGTSYPSDFKDFWEYDLASNVWTQKADFGGGNRTDAVGLAINNKGYIGTGYGYAGGIYFKDFWEYNPATNAWTRKANFGGTKRSGSVGFSIGNQGYVGTGYNPGDPHPAKKDLWEYNPNTDTWTRKANFGGSARSGAVGFSVGTMGYIGTGGGKIDFWEYNPVTNTWTRKADFGGLKRSGATGFGVNGKGYIGTGFADSSGYSFFTKDIWEYDPSLNSWTRKADFGGIPRAGATGISIGKYGFIGFGGDFFSPTLYLNDWWRYEPSGGGAATYSNIAETGINKSNGIVFSVYPNPAKDKLYINISCTENETFNIRIADMYDRQLYLEKIGSATSNFTHDIDISKLPKNIYTIQFINKKGISKTKFVKE